VQLKETNKTSIIKKPQQIVEAFFMLKDYL